MDNTFFGLISLEWLPVLSDAPGVENNVIELETVRVAP
jgi:hypothetical protein